MFSHKSSLPVAIASLMFLFGSAAANGGEFFKVRALGCGIPVPTEYVLDGEPRGSIVMIHESGAGHIQFDKFTGVPERFTVLSEKTYGHLTVAELAVKSEGRPLDSMVLIHDDALSVSLIGDAKTLVEAFVAACVPKADTGE